MTIQIKLKHITNRSEKTLFESLFKENYSNLCYFAIGYVGEHSVSEDIVQQCFEYLWKNQKRLNLNGSIKSYMYNSVKNACLNYLKHQEVERKNEHLLIEEYNISDEIDPDLHEKRMLKIVDSFKQLSEQSRKMIEMKYLDGIKVKDISIELDVSENTVKKTLSRALKKLRENLIYGIIMFHVFF